MRPRNIAEVPGRSKFVLATRATPPTHRSLRQLPTATTSGLRTPKLSSGAIEGGGSSSGGGGGGSSVSGSGAGGGGGASNGIGSGEAIVQTKRCVVGLSGGAYFSTIVAGLAESAKGFHSSHMSTTGKVNENARRFLFPFSPRLIFLFRFFFSRRS